MHSDMQTTPVKLMLVDDHVVVRRGLKALLELDQTFAVVAEAGSAAEALEQARRTRPDVVIMDVRLPDGSGVEVCREIRSERPATRVIMLTSYPDDEAMATSVLAGASGYLLKDLNEEALRRSLAIVAQGGSLLEPDVVLELVSRLRPQTDPEAAQDPNQLSNQEWQILNLIAEGKTNREISQAVYLSQNTVKNYVSRILDKLSLNRRAEAAAFVARHRWGR